MANPVFPQLSSGAQVQYPLRKRRIIQPVLNSFADGTMLASSLNSNTQRVWQLAYTELTDTDQAVLQNHFVACSGALLPFTFIDPTDNMLASSIDFTSTWWINSSSLSIVGGAADPLGGNTAFTVVNQSGQAQLITQNISSPTNFQYCFSLYAAAPADSSISMGWGGEIASQSQSYAIGSNWKRLINSAQVADGSPSMTVSISVPAAQTVIIWGPQLEPQISPGRYRPTSAAGGVYQNAHLLGDSITFESDAPGLFSTLISIETT